MRSTTKTARQRVNAANRKRQELFKLAKRFRNAKNSQEAGRLGDKLGGMVFGD